MKHNLKSIIKISSQSQKAVAITSVEGITLVFLEGEEAFGLWHFIDIHFDRGSSSTIVSSSVTITKKGITNNVLCAYVYTNNNYVV